MNMCEDCQMTAHELLAMLAFSPRTLDHLERLYAAQQAKGEDVAADVRCLRLWQDIRGDGKAPIDGVKAETWEQAGLVVVKSTREMSY